MGYNIFRKLFKREKAEPEVLDDDLPTIVLEYSDVLTSLTIDILETGEIDVSTEYDSGNVVQAESLGQLFSVMDEGSFGFNCLSALLQRAEDSEDDDLMAFLVLVAKFYQQDMKEQPVVSPTQVFRQ